MSTDTQHLVYHRSRVSDLEHELALARASSDYWRTKYVTEARPPGFMSQREWTNARYWFEHISVARSPMDECDE